MDPINVLIILVNTQPRWVKNLNTLKKLEGARAVVLGLAGTGQPVLKILEHGLDPSPRFGEQLILISGNLSVRILVTLDRWFTENEASHELSDEDGEAGRATPRSFHEIVNFAREPLTLALVSNDAKAEKELLTRE